ncbi:GTPase Obg [Trichinella pseudospiralis]
MWNLEPSGDDIGKAVQSRSGDNGLRRDVMAASGICANLIIISLRLCGIEIEALAEKKRQAGRQAGSKAGKEEEEEEEELYKWGGARPKKIQIQPQDRYLGDMVTEEWMGTPSRIHCPTMKAILDQLDHLDRQNIAAHQAEQSFVKAELIVNLLTGSSGGGGGGLRHFQHDHALIQLLQLYFLCIRKYTKPTLLTSNVNVTKLTDCNC